MRDPERLSSGNGISDFERELLDAGKNETMPAVLRDQMERALGLGGAASAGVPVRARVEAATGVKASAMVWISAGVVVLGVVGGLVGSRLGSRLFSPPRPVAPVMAPAAVTAPAPSAPPAGPSSAVGARAGVPALAPAPAAPPPARRVLASAAEPARSRAHDAASHAATARMALARRGHGSAPAKAVTPAAPVEISAPLTASIPSSARIPPEETTPAAAARAVASGEARSHSDEPAPARAAIAPSGDLRAEIDLIDGARAALRAGDSAQALDLLGRHAVHFPHGALAPEETALRVEALMHLGRTAEARVYARRFVAANPASPLAQRMRRLVNGATTP